MPPRTQWEHCAFKADGGTAVVGAAAGAAASDFPSWSIQSEFQVGQTDNLQCLTRTVVPYY